MPIVTTPDGVEHDFPDGATPDQMKKALAGYIKSPAAPTAVRNSMLGTRAGMALAGMRPALLNSLPAAGGLGGMAFGPFGSFAGGAIGEGARMMADPSARQFPSLGLPVMMPGGAMATMPPGVSGPLGQMGMAGMGQGLADWAGVGIGKTMTGAAGAMMRGALRPAKKLAAAAPTVVKDALAEGAVVGGGGSARIGAKLGASGAKTTRLLEAAGRAGLTVRPERVVPGVADLVSQQTPHLSQAQEAAQKLIDDFLASHPSPKSPAELKEMKDVSYAEAQRLLEGLQAGKRVTQAMPLEARFHLKLAENLKRALEQLPKYGNAIGRSEARSSKLIDVKNAIRDAEVVTRSGVSPLLPQTVGRGSAAALGGAVGYGTGDSRPQQIEHSVLGALLGAGLATPQALSRMAYAPNSQFAQFLLAKLGAHALTMLFPPGGAPPDQTQAPPAQGGRQ